MTLPELRLEIEASGDRLCSELRVAAARMSVDAEVHADQAEAARANWLEAESVVTALHDVCGDLLREHGTAAHETAAKHRRAWSAKAARAYGELRSLLEPEVENCAICDCDIGHPGLAVPLRGVGRGMAHPECVEGEESEDEF